MTPRGSSSSSVGRPPMRPTEALRAARKTRNHALWERNQLLKLWIQASGLVAHLEPPARADLLFPAVLCVHTPAGQLTWKLSLEDVDEFCHLPSNGVSHWDGARASEKDDRLSEVVKLAIDDSGAVSCIDDSGAVSCGDGGILDGSQLTFVAYQAVQDALALALAQKPGTGTYAAFVAPDWSDVRLSRYLPRFIARLPKDAAGRFYDPADGWLYAGTLTK